MVQIDPSVIQWTRPEAERRGTPLVVAMHGVGSHERDLLGLAPALPAAWTMASLRAPLPFGPGFSWYPLAAPGAPDLDGVDAATEAVLAFIDGIRDEHTEIGLLGFSQGGSMALQVLRARPSDVAFAICLAGFVAPGVTDDRDAAVDAVRPPVFYGHGDADQVIPAAASARTADWVRAHTTATVRTYPGLGHAISAEELADVRAFMDAPRPSQA